jgi:hypothetical protein
LRWQDFGRTGLQARLQLAGVHKKGELRKIPRSGMKTRTTHQDVDSPQLQSVAEFGRHRHGKSIQKAVQQ